MFKKILRRFLTDLGEMEGDYRVFYLKDDVAYSILYISIAILGVLSMIGMDALLSQGPARSLFIGQMVSRGVFTLISILVMIALWKTSKVRVFDRIILGWLSFTVLFFLLQNFTTPDQFPDIHRLMSSFPLPFTFFRRSRLILTLCWLLAFLSVWSISIIFTKWALTLSR